MIEIIAPTAALILVVSLAAFAWLTKRRLDDLELAVYLLSERVTVLYQAQEHGGRAILRKAGEE